MEKNLGIFPFVYKCWPPHFLCGIGAVLCQVVLGLYSRMNSFCIRGWPWKPKASRKKEVNLECLTPLHRSRLGFMIKQRTLTKKFN